MTGCRPRVLPLSVITRQCGGIGRQQHLDIALDCHLHPAADEGRGVLEDPDELIGQCGDLDADRARELAAGHEKNGNLGVARPHCAQQSRRLFVSAVVITLLRPIEQDAVDAGIGDDRRQAVLVRNGFHDLEVPASQLRYQGVHAARGRTAGLREPAVDNKDTSGERAGSSTWHHGASLTVDLRVACSGDNRRWPARPLRVPDRPEPSSRHRGGTPAWPAHRQPQRNDKVRSLRPPPYALNRPKGQYRADWRSGYWQRPSQLVARWRA